MKKLLSLAALFAFAVISLTGCNTKTNVPENTQEPTGDWNSAVGTLTVYYPRSSMEDVFTATKKGIDDLYGLNSRVGEDLNKKSICVYARIAGDIRVTVDISVLLDAKTKTQKTQAVISYGTWGNLAESQKVAGAISKHIK